MTDREIAEEHPFDPHAKRRLLVRRIFKYGVLGPLSALFLVALLVPRNIFDGIPGLASLCREIGVVASLIVPGIDIEAHSRATSFPQAALVADALALAVLPIILLSTLFGLLLGYSYGRTEKDPLATMSLPALIVALIVATSGYRIAPWMLQVFYSGTGDPTVYAGITTRSRFGFASLTSLTIFFSAAVLWLQPLLCVLLIDKLFFKKYSDERPDSE